MLSLVKNLVRLFEARFSPCVTAIRFQNRVLKFVRSLWWNEATQSWFDAEIQPYFDVLNIDRPIRGIVDAGGSTGSFSIAAAMLFPEARIDIFEPSSRQQIMIRRNVRLNNMEDRIHVQPFGLWNEPERLEFRTHGAISSLEKVSMLDKSLPFDETVKVMPLDSWLREEGIQSLDLIKMDVEGAEIEALQGAAESLKKFRPDILLQAYHIRNGHRTLETCVAFLEEIGYICHEVKGADGFVHARMD